MTPYEIACQKLESEDPVLYRELKELSERLPTQAIACDVALAAMTSEKLISLFGEGTEEVESVPEWPVVGYMDKEKVLFLARKYERESGKRLDRPGKG